MVTEKIDYINDGVITPQNIDEYYKRTLDAVLSLDNIDIFNFLENISELVNIYNTNMRIISDTQPENSKKGMVWFITSN